jgi:hypothetical protein
MTLAFLVILALVETINSFVCSSFLLDLSIVQRSEQQPIIRCPWLRNNIILVFFDVMSMHHMTVTFFAWRCFEATWLVLPSFLFNICYIFRCSWERWLVFRCTNCCWEINLRWNPIRDLLVTSMAHHSLILLLGKSLQELTCMVSVTGSKQ